MRSFILSLPVCYQLLFIVLGTVLVAFVAAVSVFLLFGSLDLIPKAGLITAIYAVLGTIYAVLIAFCVSGVWQNYCASEMSVTSEVAALMDLVHTVSASSNEKVLLIKDLALEYLKHVVELEWPILAKGKNELIMSPQSKSFRLSLRIIETVQTIHPHDARDNVIFSHALTLLTKWLDARRLRIMISKGNIAKSLWPLLIAGAFILFAFHGLFIVENRVLWTTLLLFFSGVIGLSFYLIFSLDCPFSGMPVVDSSPYKWAITWLSDEKTLAPKKQRIPT